MGNVLRPIRDCLGRERDVVRAWPDGSYECPFCSSPVMAPSIACANPGCPAGGLSADNARAALARQEAAEADRQARESAYRFMTAWRKAGGK